MRAARAGLTKALCRSADAADQANVLMLLAHLATTQTQFTELPPAVLEVMQAPGAVEELARLQASGTQLQPLLGVLLPAAMRALDCDGDPSQPAAAIASLLWELVTGLDLRAHARPATEQLLSVIARAGEPLEPSVLAQLQQTLRCTVFGCSAWRVLVTGDAASHFRFGKLERLDTCSAPP